MVLRRRFQNDELSCEGLPATRLDREPHVWEANNSHSQGQEGFEHPRALNDTEKRAVQPLSQL